MKASGNRHCALCPVQIKKGEHVVVVDNQLAHPKCAAERNKG